jgi:hypothetical protein
MVGLRHEHHRRIVVSHLRDGRVLRGRGVNEPAVDESDTGVLEERKRTAVAGRPEVARASEKGVQVHST